MKKFFASFVRTVVAVAIIAAGIAGFALCMDWPMWAPNNWLGFCVVLGGYVAASGILTFGIYLLSPMFWQLIIAFVMDVVMDSQNRESKKAVRKVRHMQRTFLW